MPKIDAFIEPLEPRQFLSATGGSSVGAPDSSGGGLYASATRPSVTTVNFGGIQSLTGAAVTNVDRDAGVVAELSLPNGGVNDQTFYPLGTDGKPDYTQPSYIRIYKVNADKTLTLVESSMPQTSGGGDTIVLQPKSVLAANTHYRFAISNTVKDLAGNAFQSKQVDFTTGTGISASLPDINFAQSTTDAGDKAFSAVTIFNNRLYAASLDGSINYWDIRTDKTLSSSRLITTIKANNGGDRFITGITFDPRSTPSNPILWVSHGQKAYVNADDHTGKISRLSGANLSVYQDVVTNLPRSSQDHLNNQIVFSPDGGNFFFTQPSMSAMGDPDPVWGNRPEELMTAAVLRMDVAKIEAWLPVNGAINAEAYNPYNGANPLRIYATGIRNAYDLAFDAAGNLFAATNGSSSGGNTPDEPQTDVEVPNDKRISYDGTNPYQTHRIAGINGNPVAEDDYLMQIVEGKYYGHPNPTRGEYILNGGNPTAGRDVGEVLAYPVGTQPDPNYAGNLIRYSFGKHVSPDGTLVYNSSTAFNGALKGFLLVTNFAEGDGIVAIKTNADGSVTSKNVFKGVNGLSRGELENPLDLVEDPNTGNIYVAQLTNSRKNGKITLLTPTAPNPIVKTNRTRYSFYSVPGTNGASTTITISNTADATSNLVIDRLATKITGVNKRSWGVDDWVTELKNTGQLPPITLLPGDSYTMTMRFALAAGDSVRKIANLALRTNMPNVPYTSVQLRGFAAESASVSASAVASGGVFASAATGPQITLGQSRFFFNAVKDSAGTTQGLTIQNVGDQNLVIPAGGIRGSGPDRKSFALLSLPAGGVTIKPGRSVTFAVLFGASSAGDNAIKTATILISSNTPGKPVSRIGLRGLPTDGELDLKEPSLAKLVQLYEFPVTVGDSNPETTLLDVPPVGSTSEVKVQRLIKAGAGPVTITPLASFGVGTDPALRVGWYAPGDLEKANYLWKIAKGQSQSVAAKSVGVESFDPGSASFGLVAQFPGFNDLDGKVRKVYSEDDLNFWETKTANRRKMRFYPLGNDNYLVAVEEYTAAYDQQDVVFVVKNVKPAPSVPVASFENAVSGEPYQDTLVLSNIGTLNTTTPNYTRKTQRVRIRNTGGVNLSLNSLSITGPFSISAGTSGTIKPGEYKDVSVTFTGTTVGLSSGVLTLKTSDPNNASKKIALSGFYQRYSEYGPDGKSVEPTSQQLMELFGFKTVLTTGTQKLNAGGVVQAVGEEILSPYWRSADSSGIVSIQEIATFHTQGTISNVSWFAQGSTTLNGLFGADNEDGQTVLPRKNKVNSVLASGSFKTDGTFGLRIDSSWSDPKLNLQEKAGGNYGHRVRWFPLRDRDGALVENTYVVLVDYFNNNYSNYDYNDDVLIVSGVVPATGVPETPDLLTAQRTSQGPQLNWTAPGDKDIVGYNIYRSDSAQGTKTKLNASILNGLGFLDSTVSAAANKWYSVTSVWASGKESYAATIFA